MATIETTAPAAIKNILYLTDFSEPSEAALPVAMAIARNHRAHLQALHVLTPEPNMYGEPVYVGLVKQAEEERVRAEMQRLESQLSGLPHETTMKWGAFGMWPAVAQAIQQEKVDIIVLGTHGRTGAEKLLLGSVAEKIFRLSPVPVLTIGPRVRSGGHAGGRFRRVLFATDFSPESLAAAAQAVSLAQQNQSHLLLLFVMRKPEQRNDREADQFEMSVAEAIHRLYEIVPEDAMLPYPPEVAVEYGEPAERILGSATERGADLIVLGIRDATANGR